MLNFKFVFKMLGLMLMLETPFMLSAAGVSFYYKEGDLLPLLYSSGIMFALGALFYLIGFKTDEKKSSRREGMLTVTLTWVVYSFTGMLPYYIGGYIPSITDAFFETMSGFTTTGSSILTDIEALPKGILFWRSLTQWQGGVGMIVFTVALLPIFGGGASCLFDAETPGITHERFRPRIASVAKRLWGIYLFFTLLLIGLLWAGPMTLFDAVNHAFTCISTGGYSTKNASIAHWDSAYLEYVLSAFMLIGATNMTLFYFLINGKPSKFFKDEEFRWYMSIVLIVVLIFTAWLYFNGFLSGVEETFRVSLFHVATLISTTGYADGDFLQWGPFFWSVALFLMIVCGCAGSTCGGLKMGRFVILIKNLSNEFMKQTHPKAILHVRMNGQVVGDSVVHRVFSFAFAYIALIAASSWVLMLEGMDFLESFSAAISAIGNVGPGLGSIGPVSNYSEVPDISKWFLSFLMMIGRLEIFTVLTLLMPGFWKR